MNWRRALLTGVLAASLSLSLVPRANADPPPWAGKWRHHDRDNDHDGKWDRRHERHDWDRDHDRWHRYNDRYRVDRDDGWRYRGRNDNDWWRNRNRDGDWRRWNDRSRYDGYYGGYRGNNARYGQLMQRMDNDRAKIAELESTGRHRKALQWYKDDMRNAQRDMQNNR
jgi:hypothetical protein